MDCRDKKSGTLVVIESQIEESVTKERAAHVLSGMFIRGLSNQDNRFKPHGIKVCPDMERELGGSGRVDLERTI